jgi:hypothetical protein
VDKRGFALVLALIFLSACTERESSQHPWCVDKFDEDLFERDVMMTSNGFGPIQSGISKSAIQRNCPSMVDTLVFDGEGNEMQASNLVFYGQNVGFVVWSDSLADRVFITHPHILTPRKIRVGMTLSDLKSFLPDAQIGYDDAGVYVWSSQDSTISHMLESSGLLDVVSTPDNPDSLRSDISDSVRIRSIILLLKN